MEFAHYYAKIGEHVIRLYTMMSNLTIRDHLPQHQFVPISTGESRPLLSIVVMVVLLISTTYPQEPCQQ